MIKRTIFFGNPAYLSVDVDRLKIEKKEGKVVSFTEYIPIEDIGVIVLDHPQVMCTQSVFSRLLENNAAVVTCNSRHMPTGLLLNLEGNTVQTERFLQQIQASQPLKKQLWQQTIRQKILNQAAVLKKNGFIDIEKMYYWARSVKSGDKDNHEARAAAHYWRSLFNLEGFSRDRYGDFPNNWLNYGYAILRAVVARALVSSGLLPNFGIHHHNRYNSYCLADDIMEPYRPYVDMLVIKMMEEYPGQEDLNKDVKAKLLQIPVLDIKISGRMSPLMVGMSQTTASLYRCFAGEDRKIDYPEI